MRVLGRKAAADHDGDRGSMAIEMVFLAPIVLLLSLLVVAAGRYADMHGRVDGISRDAVRAASIQRDSSDAGAAAQQAADDAQPSGSGVTCRPIVLTGDFAPGQTISVSISCTIRLSDLGLPGMPGTVEIQGKSSAPIDLYRAA